MTTKVFLNDMIIEKRYGYFVFEGKYYEMKGSVNNGEFKMVEVKDIQDKINKAKEITEKLIDSLDGKKVLMESIMRLGKSDFNTLYRNAIEKERNAVTREHHCVDMKIGNFVLPIVE